MRMLNKKKDELDHKVYIVLSQTGTYFAKAIQRYTKEPYAHASLAFDEDLSVMYSFGRKKPTNPFFAGFVEEDIESGVFELFDNITCSVYELKVSKRQYDLMRKEIEIFQQNKESYSYNLLGLVGTVINCPVNVPDKYFCSQFVAYILYKGETKLFNKSYGLVRPFDFRMNPRLQKIYRGNISTYRTTKHHHELRLLQDAL